MLQRRTLFLSIFILLLLFGCSFSGISLSIAENDDSDVYEWWNTNWMYRISVRITENSGYSLVNFPVEAVFEHNGHVQVDGDDVRVIIDGLEVSSYVSELNGTHAKVIFEVNITASATKTVYIYYGNPHAVNPNYALIPLTITEGNNGHAIIDNSVYIGWAYTSWGWSNNVELWNDFRIDFNGNQDPTDDSDLIRDYGSRQGGVGRHRADIQAIGLGEYQGFEKNPVYVDIKFADATLRIYKGNILVETTQADTLYMFSNSYTYANCGNGTEHNMVDGEDTDPPYYDSTAVSNSNVNPGWMAFRDSASGYVIASTGLRVGENYGYHCGGKEAPDYDRNINYNLRDRYQPVEPYDQPSDCRIFWYADNTNGYSNIEGTTKILNNQPSIYVGDEELQGPYVIIDQAFVSDERADVGSTQAIGFHTRWDNGSDIVVGTLNITSVIERSRIIMEEISDGLVGYWRFDEGSGTTAYDNSSSNNYGTLVNGPTWVNGKHGKALRFDGFDDSINIESSETLRFTSSSFTIACWVKIDGSTGDHQVILSQSRSIFPGPYFCLELQPNGHTPQCAVLILPETGTCQYSVSNNNIQFGEWVYLVGTYDGSTIKIYVNGVLTGAIEKEGTLNSEELPIRIGSHYIIGEENWFKGTIDEVMLYNRALDAEEIKAHAQDSIRVTNLLPGQKVELYDNAGYIKAYDFVGEGENVAILDVSSLPYPFMGFFKIYSVNGATLIYSSPIFNDIIVGDEYSVSILIDREIIEEKKLIINSTGWITYNASSIVIGKEFWAIADVNVNGIKYYSQIVEDPSIIWDQVNITLQVENNRIGIGSLVDITWNSVYGYDNISFQGSVSFNDTLTKSVVGKYWYAVASVVDPLYGLNEFSTNQVYCIFDRMETETSFETLTPGSTQAILSLNFEFDNSPVEDATVTTNGLAAENIGNGKYQITLSSWMPYLQITFEVERAGFDRIMVENVVYPLGNIILEVFLVMIVCVTTFLLNARRIRMKEWNVKILRLEELMKDKGQIEVRRISESLETDITKTKKLFYDLETKNPALKGFFVNNDQEFMLESSFISSITRMGRADLEKIGSDLGISVTQVQEIINNLLKGGKIKGSILLDGRTFITERQLGREVRNLVAFQAGKRGEIDVHGLSVESSIPEEKISNIIEELKNQIIETISPYKNISLTDISHENNLPENLTLILVKGLVSEGRINGFIDMVNQSLTIERETKIIKPTGAWFLVPLFLGILGGVIGYLAIKNDDRKMANNVLYLGIIMSLIGIFVWILSYSWWWSIISRLLS